MKKSIFIPLIGLIIALVNYLKITSQYRKEVLQNNNYGNYRMTRNALEDCSIAFLITIGFATLIFIFLYYIEIIFYYI